MIYRFVSLIWGAQWKNGNHTRAGRVTNAAFNERRACNEVMDCRRLCHNNISSPRIIFRLGPSHSHLCTQYMPMESEGKTLYKLPLAADKHRRGRTFICVSLIYDALFLHLSTCSRKIIAIRVDFCILYIFLICGRLYTYWFLYYEMHCYQ